MPGEPFFADDAVEHGWIRLNFSHASTDAIETGIARLAGVIQQVQKQMKQG